jgi:hypothetical protein
MGKLSKADLKLQCEVFALINSDVKLNNEQRWWIYENIDAPTQKTISKDQLPMP